MLHLEGNPHGPSLSFSFSSPPGAAPADGLVPFSSMVIPGFGADETGSSFSKDSQAKLTLANAS